MRRDVITTNPTPNHMATSHATQPKGRFNRPDGSTSSVMRLMPPRHDQPKIIVFLGGGGGSGILFLLGLGLLTAGLLTGSYSMFVAGCVLTTVFGLPIVISVLCLPCLLCSR